MSDYAGKHEDENGVFTVYKAEGFPGGWFWLPEMGCPEGPYKTAQAAYEAACALDFSSNHGDG